MAVPGYEEIGSTMNRSTIGALVASAAGVLLLGGAGTLAFSATDVINVSQRQWADVIVAIGMVGYTVAMFVAAFGMRSARHVRN